MSRRKGEKGGVKHHILGQEAGEWKERGNSEEIKEMEEKTLGKNGTWWGKKETGE